MKSFTSEVLTKELMELMSRIKALEREADALVLRITDETRFLTDEERQAVIDYFADQARNSSDSDDTVDKYLHTSYYEPGSSCWTDRELLRDFLAGYLHKCPDHADVDLQEVPLWNDILSRNLAAVAVMGEFLTELNEEVRR